VITVTRLNGKPIIVNADQIRSIEENPDSTIALMNGDRIIVRENMDDIVGRVVEYGRSLRQLVPPS